MKKEKTPDESRIEDYKEYGWHYVLTVKNTFHLYMSKDENPIELHNDPITQSYTFDYLKRTLKRNSIWFFIYSITLFLLVIYELFFREYRILSVVEYDVFYIIINLIVQITVTKAYVVALKNIKIIQKNLESGRELNHKIKYKTKNELFEKIILIIVTPIFLINITAWGSYYRNRDLKSYEGDLPRIRISDIGDYNNLIEYNNINLDQEHSDINVDKNIVTKAFVEIHETLHFE